MLIIFLVTVFYIRNHHLEAPRSLSYTENMTPNFRCSKVLQFLVKNHSKENVIKKKKAAHSTGFTSKTFLKCKKCIPQWLYKTFLSSEPVSYSVCFSWGWGRRMLFGHFLMNSGCSQTLGYENTPKSFRKYVTQFVNDYLLGLLISQTVQSSIGSLLMLRL